MRNREREQHLKATGRSQPIVIPPAATMAFEPPLVKRAKKVSKGQQRSCGASTTTAARPQPITTGQLQQALRSSVVSTQSLQGAASTVAAAPPANTTSQGAVAGRPAATVHTPKPDYALNRFLNDPELSTS